MGFVGKAFRKWLHHEDGTLVTGISAFIIETPESSLIPSATWENNEKEMSIDSETSSHQTPLSASNLTLDFLASRTMRNKSLSFINYQLCDSSPNKLKPFFSPFLPRFVCSILPPSLPPHSLLFLSYFLFLPSPAPFPILSLFLHSDESFCKAKYFIMPVHPVSKIRFCWKGATSCYRVVMLNIIASFFPWLIPFPTLNHMQS